MQKTALKALIDTAIRQQTTAGAITPAVLANLLDALAEIFPQEVTLAYSASLSWNIATQGTIGYLDLGGNCVLTITGLSSGSHGSLFVKGNGHTIIVNGKSVMLEAEGETMVGFTNFFSTLRLSANGSTASTGGGTSTAPVVTGLNASANLITVGFDMSVTTPALSGWSFTRNSAALVPTGVTSPAAGSWQFVVPTILAGETILANYNAAVGDVKNLSNEDLASFTNRAVTNNVSGGGVSVTAGPTAMTFDAADPANVTQAGTRFTPNGGAVIVGVQHWPANQPFEWRFSTSDGYDLKGMVYGLDDSATASFYNGGGFTDVLAWRLGLWGHSDIINTATKTNTLTPIGVNVGDYDTLRFKRDGTGKITLEATNDNFATFTELEDYGVLNLALWAKVQREGAINDTAVQTPVAYNHI